MDTLGNARDYLYNLNPFLRSDNWEDDAAEKLEQLVFKGMEVFVIFMALFFAFFVYYFVFGIVVGSISESNMTKDTTKTEEKVVS